MKIEFNCDTWGMSSVEYEVNLAVEILNNKDWTEKQKNIIEKMFKSIENEMESLKELASGDDW